MFDLTGKGVLLTGATGGICKSIAKKMKEKGAKLILSGTKQNILNELSSELGSDTKAIATDLTSKESILSLAKEHNSSLVVCTHDKRIMNFFKNIIEISL